jgi:DNA repair exonuclease SbcCD ATPase subunit
LSRTEIAFDARKLTLTTLKSDVDIAKRDSEEKEAEIKQLKRDLKSLAASADELREAKVLSSDEVKRLKDKLKNSIDDAKEKDRTIDRLKSEITDLESKLTKMRSTEGSATLSRGASTYGIQRTSSSAQVTDDSSKSSVRRMPNWTVACVLLLTNLSSCVYFSSQDEVALLRRQIAAKDDALAALDSSASGDRVGTRLVRHSLEGHSLEHEH